MNSKRILVVEDDPLVLKVLTDRLRDKSYEIVAARNIPDAVHEVRTRAPDLMILDLNLRERDKAHLVTNGLAFLSLLRRSLPEAGCPVIVYSVDTSERVRARARSLGVDAVIDKSRPLAELLGAVASVLKDAAPAERLHSTVNAEG
jgi:CheY-like chemotaxis protein